MFRLISPLRPVGAAAGLLFAAFVGSSAAQELPDPFDPASPTTTTIMGTQSALNPQVTKQFTAVTQDVIDAAIASAFQPDPGPRANARCSHTDHSGVDFTATSPAFTASGRTVGYDANECSIMASLEFDLTDKQIFGPSTNFLLGVFGGYTHLDVDFDQSDLARTLGVAGNDATNNAWLIGGYATVAHNGFYAVGSTAFMAGESRIQDHLSGASGAYDNHAYMISATAGKSIPLNDRLNLDFRGSLQYVNHDGDAFTDSLGNVYGKSNLSYWQGQFGVGLFGNYTVNDVVIRPYVRAALSTKFSYKNVSEVGGIRFDFDKGDDVLVSLSAGSTANLTPHLQLSGEVNGDFSGDETTLGGKLGLKYHF